MLGGFAVEYRGTRVPQTAWKRKRPVELLTTLSLAQGHLLHREELIDKIWPDKDLDAGANNLYRTLHDLRKLTGDDVVSLDRGVVRLAEGTWTDVAAFETASASGERDTLGTAIELYRGELLPDDPYSDAIIARREGLRQRFVDAALRLVDSYADAPEQQVDVLRRVLEADATLERAQRLLMMALAASNRPKDALRQFAACVKALRGQLDTEPSAETVALYQRIKDGTFAPAAADTNNSAGTVTRAAGWDQVAGRLLGSTTPPAIRGRDDVLKRFEQFTAGDDRVMLLVGEAGVGKTRLAVELARMCHSGGASVMAGLGYDFEGIAPYTPFVDAWSEHLRVLDRNTSENPFLAFAPVPGASAQEDRLRLFQAVERSVLDVAGNGSLCVIIEDLHQADESSLQLFHHLARAAKHLPLRLIGTLREEEIAIGRPLHTLLAGLGRERLAVRTPLARLDRDATRTLIVDLYGETPSAELVESVFRLAGGNPFYTEELVRTLSEDGEPELSEDLLESVRSRVSRLGQDAERLFAAASVQDIRFDFDVARAAAEMNSSEALDALDLGLAGRVVEEHDGRYRFRHALMRQALYDSLSRARRVHLHRATASTLEREAGESNAFAEMLAFHYQAAGQNDRALPHLLEAVKKAQSRLGFGEAVVFCQRALELMDDLGMPAGPERLQALQSVGGMRVALGDLDQAVSDLDAAAALHNRDTDWRPTPTQRANSLRLAALALIEAGNMDSAEKHILAALELVEQAEPSIELSSVLYLFSQLRWHQDRHAEAFEMAERCLREAEAHDDPQAIAKGYEMLALACHSLGEWQKGTEFEERRQELADGTLDVASAFDVHL